MTDPRNLLGGRGRVSQQSAVWIGTVTTAPASEADPLVVSSRDLDVGRSALTVRGWSALSYVSGAALLPVIGDTVAIEVDADGSWWCVGWEPVTWPADPGGGGGVTDHGALTGLGDDDHTQYHTDGRGDARYWQLSTDLATQAELDGHTGDTSGAHAASAISIADAAGDFTATDVEGALAELQSDAEADATALADHIADATAAHAGTAISNTPAGTIAATTVQAAIDELDTEKATTGSVTTVATDLSNHLSDATDAHDASAISVMDAGAYFAGADVEAVLQELGGISGGTPSASGVTVTETGLIIPNGTTSVQDALYRVEAWAQNLEERFEQHHHDERYYKTSGFIGRVTSVAGVSTGSIANLARSGFFFTSHLALTGDGTNYIRLALTVYGPYISAGTPGHWNMEIYDETAGTVLNQCQLFQTATGLSFGGRTLEAYLPPFTGTKSFNLRFTNATGGASTVDNQAAATYPTTLTAHWAGPLGHN